MNFWKRIFPVIIFTAKVGIVSSSVFTKTLYINRGSFVTVASTSFPALAFNETAAFNALNAVIDLTTNDTLQITISNNDSIPHGFEVKNFLVPGDTISSGNSKSYSIHSNNEGVFLFYDPLNYPANRYMGLGGMICVSNSSGKKYYWNIKEHEMLFNNSIGAGASVSFNSYNPDYFTINGKSFPDLQNDSTAVPDNSIGDTIIIFMVNTGQSKHAIHFHGFHPKAVYSTIPQQNNRIKDTWPLESMEGYVLQLVADKQGQYSVHDHNLVAVSGGGIHPNGMFLIMKFQ